ncbi:MAG: hypothetical protein SGPRY_003403 [Prymnesium sp.]
MCFVGCGQTRVFEGHRLEFTSCAQHTLGWVDLFLNVGSSPLLASSRRRHEQWADHSPPTPRVSSLAEGGEDEGVEDESPEDSLRRLLEEGASLAEEGEGGEGGEGGARICHAFYLCGKATFLSPLWIELADFKVFVALQASLGNLSSSWSNTWRRALYDTVQLVEAINAHIRAQRPALLPPSIALVQLPSQELSKQFLLLTGVGEPSLW